VFSAFTPRVLVRLQERGTGELVQVVARTPYVMENPEKGWSSFGHRVTWEHLGRLVGWRLDGQHEDTHGAGFWLAKENPDSDDGRADCPHGYPGRAECDRGCEAAVSLIYPDTPHVSAWDTDTA
jgi:hypothetical protein